MRLPSWIMMANLALSLAATATTPGHALTLFPQEFTCPIGGEKFTAEVVGSYTQFGIRLDFKPVGAMLAPIPLPVCPQNGFVMYKETFSEAELDQLKKIVLSDDYRQARANNTDYYMVGYMRERMGADSRELAFIYLRASWEADRKPELLTPYRTLVLQKFDEFLARDNSRSEQWWVASIVTAELERLLGRFDAAVSRLDKLPKQDPGTMRAKMIDQIRAYAQQRDATVHELNRK